MCARVSIGVTTLSPFSSVSKNESGNESPYCNQNDPELWNWAHKGLYLQNFPDLSSRSKTVAGNITLPLESSTMMYAELQWKSIEWDCTHSMVFEV